MLVLLGCTRASFDLKPNETLTTPSYRISITGKEWRTGQNPSDRLVKFQGKYDRLWFNRHLPNMLSEDVEITVHELSKESMSRYNYELLDKEKSDILEKTILTKPLTDWEKKNHAERRVNYSKGYIDYINGLRCRTTVESSNIALGVGRKSYQTFCNYYDTHGNPKELWIMYDYMYTHSGTKFQDDKSSNNVVTPEAMQLQFKQDMKAIFDSLQIHDMDRAKMKELGLLHDRAYEIQEW